MSLRIDQSTAERHVGREKLLCAMSGIEYKLMVQSTYPVRSTPARCWFISP